jgi:hypothetical protein
VKSGILASGENFVWILGSRLLCRSTSLPVTGRPPEKAELPREEGVIGQMIRSFIMEMSHGFHVPERDNRGTYDLDFRSERRLTAKFTTCACMKYFEINPCMHRCTNLHMCVTRLFSQSGYIEGLICPHGRYAVNR